MSIKWGFLSTANITFKVEKAIGSSENAQLVAIASREIEKATSWIEKLKKKTDSIAAYGTYDELYQDDQVEAIYIPLPSALKKPWALKGVEHDKHLLCDKPFTSAQEVQEIVEACKKHNLVFMDNTMFVHHPRTQAISEILKSGELGIVNHIYASFTFFMPDDRVNDVRIQKHLEPLGALGDVGWYCARAILVTTDFELPSKVFATANYKNGTIFSLNAICWFHNSHKTASFYCGFDVTIGQHLIIAGTKKTLTVTDFVLPWNAEFSKTPQSDKAVMQLRDLDGVIETRGFKSPKKQETLLIEEFSRLVERRKTGLPDVKVEEKWARQSLLTQKFLDALFESASTSNFVSI